MAKMNDHAGGEPDARGAFMFTVGTALLLVISLAFVLPRFVWAPPRSAVTHASAQPAATPPPPASLASVWVSQSTTPVYLVGQTAITKLVLRNTGTATWIKGSPSEVRLGVVGTHDPRIAIDWPYPGRPAIQEEDRVRPGETASFTFQLRPVAAGAFRLNLRPVVDGVTWLTDEGIHIALVTGGGR